MIIDSIRLYRLKAMLRKPYHTAFGDLEYFDATVALAASERGEAAGESTAVLGYSWESPDDVWRFALEQAPRLMRKDTKDAREFLAGFEQGHPFGVAPLLSALEKLDGAFPFPRQEWTFPLVGTLNTPVEREIPDALERLLDEEFTTIKFKIGFDLEEDIRKIKIIQSILGGRGLLRLDANQKYSLDQAFQLVKEVRPDGIELLEQPFAAGDWKSMELFAPHSPMPLMLDESIYGVEAIRRVLENRCADYIKLKVMKSGGLHALLEQARQVLDGGLRLVVGNGAATDISCADELLVAREAGLRAAGEMNGYLKLVHPLIPQALGFHKGKAVLTPGADPFPDPELLRRQAVAFATFK